MTAPTTSCTTRIEQLAAAERQAAYDVAHQNVVICENRCEITAIKKHLARLTSIEEPEAFKQHSQTNQAHSRLAQAVPTIDCELQTTGKSFSSRIVELASNTLTRANTNKRRLAAAQKCSEEKIFKDLLVAANADFYAKQLVLKSCIEPGGQHYKTAHEALAPCELKLCDAWKTGYDNPIKTVVSARNSHWNTYSQCLYFTKNRQMLQPTELAYKKFPPSMRLYPGPDRGVKSEVDTPQQRKLAQRVDEAEARIESIVLALEDLRTQYNNKKVVAEDAVKVAEQSSAEKSGILNKEQQALAQLKNDEDKIADKVEKARKHVDVVTQEEVVSVAHTDYGKAMGKVNKGKEEVSRIHNALECIESSQGLWIPFKEAMNAVQAAEEQLWLAGEELRIAELTYTLDNQLYDLARNNIQSCDIYQRCRPDITLSLLQQINEQPKQTKADIKKSLLEFKAERNTSDEQREQIIALFYALYDEDASLVSTRDLLKTQLETREQANSNPQLPDAKERLDKACQRLQSVRAEAQEFKQKWEDAVKMLDINVEKMQEKEEIWELTQARLELAKMQIPATNTNDADGQGSQNQSDVMWTALIKLPKPTGIAKPPSVQPINPSHQHGIDYDRLRRYMKHR
jgi:hypothetical protein